MRSLTQNVVVFGGTGFLGRRIVRHLLNDGYAVRVASRHPERGTRTFPDKPAMLDFVYSDVGEDESISPALAHAFGVVNAVSLYVERGNQTFHSVHVQAAERLARHARNSGTARLVHVSGIGADVVSSSPYISSRGRGERAVRAAFPAATIVRSAVMFGPDDAFLVPLTGLLRKFPVFPVFGGGQSVLQPAYVEDVGEAIARIFDTTQPLAVYELAGPNTYTYKELLQVICKQLGLRRTLVSVPFTIWQFLSFLAEYLPKPPIARNQVELMRIDNVASPVCAGFSTLGI